MRRVLLAVLLLSAAVLAGCSDGGGKPETTEADAFDDLGVQATETTGVLLGVVVDEAIRPLKGAQVNVALPDGSRAEKTTDSDGRFAFGDLQPGTYLVEATMLQFASVQTSLEVKADEADPPVHRIQLARLFAQAPYAEQITFEGFVQCAYAVGVSSTCVNDYTRLVGFVPGCEGGCLRDYDVASAGGNIREFVTAVGPGWQTMVMEMFWEPSVVLPVSQGTMGMTVSYFGRTSTSHFYGQLDGPNPLRLEIDVGVEAEGQAGDPALIPPEGLADLFVFFGAGSGDVAVNQSFRFFQTNFYYSLPPEGWSFANGDPLPF